MFITLMSALYCLLIILSFWGIIYALWSKYFTVEPLEIEINDRKKELRDNEEELALLEDLMRQVNIVQFTTDKKKVDDLINNLDSNRRSLTDLGVAENRSAVRKDEDRGKEMPEEHWLCDGRPVWFAIIQFFPCWLLTIPLSLLMPTALAALITFTIVTTLIGLMSVVQVEENWRLGVKRFGIQQNGYLSANWQFLILPGLVETPELITLQDFVWGPQLGTTSTSEDFHLNGALGTEANPDPGKFKVYLHGAWPIDIIVLVTLRVRHASKYAWWRYLNAYSGEEEIGEQIAGIALSILTTYAREVEEIVGNDSEEEKNDEEKYKEAVRTLLLFLNQMPEVSGKILLALQELGRNRLAGILPISVAIASVAPGKEFLELRQSLDRAKMDRLRQEIDAEGTERRLQIMNRVLESIDNNEQRQQLIALEKLDTQRSFARDQSSIDTIFDSLGLKFTQEGTSNSDQKGD